MGSPFTNTALALVALKKYGPRGDESDAAAVQERIDAAVARGRTWLLDAKPTHTEDKVFRLRGLVAVAADKKIAAIKVLRDATGLGLKEAKDAVDNVASKPAMVKQSVSGADADDLRKKLEDAGCTVKLV